MKFILHILGFLFKAILLLAFPFWLFLRGNIWLYEAQGWNHWLAITAMAFIVFIVVRVMVLMLWDWLAGPQNLTRNTIKFQKYLVGILVLGYVGITLLNLSGDNAKSEKIQNEYRELHPFLRMAVGTWVWLDGNLMITDGARVPEDYKKMGLKSKKNSLHYKQSTGYVHAMDLRTKGRGELRNTLLKGYFQLLGFNTLRHHGTGDHLHISLSVKDRPGAI